MAMSAFDIDLNVIHVEAATPSDDEVSLGAPQAVHVAMTIGQLLPFRGPDGQPVIAPLGTVRCYMDKESANKIATAANELPDPKPESGLITASNLSEVEQAAKRMEELSGRNGKA